MVIRRRVKGLFVLLMTAVLFLSSIPARAAEPGFGSAPTGDFILEETDAGGMLDSSEWEAEENIFVEYPDETVIESAEKSESMDPDDPMSREPRGHIFVPGKVVETQGTCVTRGKRTTYCAAINCTIHSPIVESTTFNKNKHEKKTTIDTPSTCTRQGQYGWRCDACKESDISYRALLPHKYNNLLVTQPGNCQKKTEETRSCSCGARTVVYTGYGDHSWEYYSVQSTCHSNGERGQKCSICETRRVMEKFPLAPHRTYIVEKPATTTEEGYVKERCHDCSYSYTLKTYPKLSAENSQTGNQTGNEAKEQKDTNVETITAGDPVNVFTGANEIDFKVVSAGGAQNLTVGLSYKSDKTMEGIFGKGFSWNYESFVEEKDGKILLYHSPSEFVAYNKENGNDFYTTEAKGSENDRLYKNADNTVTLKSNGKTFDYNAVGKLVRYTTKTGNSTSIEYQEKKTVLRDDVSGQTITLFFNDKNLVEKVANNGTAEAYFEYDEKNRLVKFTDVDGFITQYTYDDSDHVLTGTDNDGNVFFVNTYDEEGRIVKQKDASGKETSFSYTDNGEAGKTTVFTDRNGNTRTHTFSKEGRLLSLTDEEGGTTYSEYDEGGNCIKKTDALGNSVVMEYDDRHNLVKSTDALGNVTEFAYDENDNLVKITYPNGSEVTNTYDSNNRLVSSTDLRGLTTNNTYDENGFLIKTESGDKVSELTYENGMLKTVTDSLGNVTAYTYDENGNLIETKAPDGAVTSQTVSAYGAVKSTKDALNNEKFYTRNCFDKPLSVKDEAGYETKYSYDERQLLIESKDSKGNVTTYTYDNEERLVKTTYPDGSFTQNVYDKAGRLIETADAEGNRTSAKYDKAGRVVKETDREGNSSEISYDANENVTSRKDAKGNLTTYTYDEMGRVSTVTNAFNGVTEYTYNDAGDLTKVKDPMGNVSSYTYDIYGRKTSETDPNGNVTRFEYDLNGNLIKSIDALNNEVAYEYDGCNRLVSTKSGDAVVTHEYDLNGRTVATTDPLGNRSETVYDERGYVSKNIDALGNETSYKYDGNGNLVSVTDANGHTTTYAINNVNLVTDVTDALGLSTSFSYDKNGRRNKSTNPMGGVSTCIFDKTGNALTLTGPEGATTDFTYDANGNLTSRSTVDGNSVKYTYNALNLAESFANGREQTTTYEYDLNGRIVKSVSPESTVTYTYDANSNVLTVTDVSGTISRTYDALNRVTSVTDTKGRTVSYEYDSYGNLKTLTYPDNTSVSYTYDLCGNIKTVTDWEGRVTAYTYDALNREIEAINPNRTKSVKEYDAVGNLVKTSALNSTTGEVIDETIYEYDEINRLVSESRPHRNFKYVYEYDDLSRVTKRSTITLNTGESCYDEVFEYDGAGNINAAENGDNRNNRNNLAYNTADNRIESFNNLGFGFDNDGNMTSMAMAEGTSLDVEGIKAKGINAILNYDSHNRLISGIIDARGTVADLNIDATAKLFSNYGYDAEDYRTCSSFNVGVYPDLPDGLMLPDSLESVPEAETATDITDEPESDAVSDSDMASGNDAVSDDNTVSDNDAVSGNDSVPEKETQEEANEEDNDVSEGDILPVMPEPETDTDSFENGEITVLSGNIETEGVSDSEETEVTAEDVSGNADSYEQEISAESEEKKLDEETVSEDTTSSLEERLINRIDESSLEDIVTKEENFDSITSAMEPTAILEYAESYEYCYDRENKNLLVRYSEDGTLEKYVYGNGLIASSETRESQSPKYRTYLYDLRGSVTFALDSSANITSEYQYSTYGTRGVVKGNTTSELGYCARDGVLTEVTGLLYMRARYYMPDFMRFINQDIVTGDISNSNSLNRYTYVEGNPATMIDPFGLCAEKVDNNIRSLMSLLDEFEVGKVKWNKSAITYENMSVLYDTLVKYNIILPEQICAFLACCTLETGDGTKLTEAYRENDRYIFKYRGGGYIHLTFEYGYQAYAVYKLLENNSALEKYGTYLSPADYYDYMIDEEYDSIVSGIDSMREEMNSRIDGLGEYWVETYISKYTEIYEEGADYVAKNFAWDSAGYYWAVAQQINEMISSGDSENKIRKAIEAVNSNGASLDTKMDYYNELIGIYNRLDW